MPPSAMNAWPVVNADSSLARWTASAAISPGRAEASHRLAIDERLPDLRPTAQGRDPLIERGRLHGAGADGVASHPLPDEIGRHRLGEADDRGLGGGVDAAHRHPLHAGHHGGDGHDRAAAALDHARQHRAHHPVRRLHVQVEREVPRRLVAVEDRAVVHVSGAARQHLERSPRRPCTLAPRLRRARRAGGSQCPRPGRASPVLRRSRRWRPRWPLRARRPARSPPRSPAPPPSPARACRRAGPVRSCSWNGSPTGAAFDGRLDDGSEIVRREFRRDTYWPARRRPCPVVLMRRTARRGRPR